MRKNSNSQKDIELRNQLIQQANNATSILVEKGLVTHDEAPIANIRSDVSPPAKPDKSRFNPDQIVDIVTFIEHPYFCNLKPYPWQRLILKCFYMGQEGNTNLNIQDVEDKENAGCSGCVWEYIKNDELSFHKSIKAEKRSITKFTVVNSPCLTCKRFPDDIRSDRYEDARQQATNPDAERQVEELSIRPIIDGFQTEKDLLYSDEFDPKLRYQVEDKCTKRYKFEELVLVLGRRSGKLLNIDTMLYTTNGWSTMGDVKAGDYVFAPDGTPTKVVAKSDIDYDEQAYELVFSNGDKIIAGENHEWVTLTKAQRKNASRGQYSKDPVPQVFTTKQIYESLTYGKQTIENGLASVGLEINNIIKFSNSSLKPFGSFQYGLDFSNSSDAKMNYVSDTSTIYTYTPGINSTHLLTAEAGFNYELKDHLKLTGIFKRIQGSGSQQSNNVRFGFHYISQRETEYAMSLDGSDELKTGLNISKNINGFDIKLGSNYSLMSQIPDYGVNLKISNKF